MRNKELYAMDANGRVHSTPDKTNSSKTRGRSKRAIFLTWLRKTHLYIGLWGAVLGLAFGATGLLLNHRAILKLPVTFNQQRTVHLPLPAEPLRSPADMSRWLQQELSFTPEQVARVKSEPVKTVVWAEKEVVQPERWSFSMHRPDRGVNVEYFVGNRFVKLDHIDATLIGTLARLHMSVGVSAFWVLLSDTIAGSLILLSLTGLLLWTQLHTVKTIAVMTSMGALGAALWYAGTL